MTLAGSWTAAQGVRLDDDGLARLQRRLEIRRRVRIVEVTAAVAGVAAFVVALASGTSPTWAMAVCLAVPGVVQLGVGEWRNRAERAVLPTGTVRYARPARLRASTALGVWYLTSLVALLAVAVGGAFVSLAAGRTGVTAVAGVATTLVVGHSWFVVRRGLAVPAVGTSPAELVADERLRTMAIRDDLNPVGLQLYLVALLASGSVGVPAGQGAPWLIATQLLLMAHQLAAGRWPWSRPLAEAARARWRDVDRLLLDDLRVHVLRRPRGGR